VSHWHTAGKFFICYRTFLASGHICLLVIIPRVWYLFGPKECVPCYRFP
jgi:hypothetical protein